MFDWVTYVFCNETTSPWESDTFMLSFTLFGVELLIWYMFSKLLMNEYDGWMQQKDKHLVQKISKMLTKYCYNQHV